MFPATCRFPNRSIELRFARVMIRIPEARKLMTAELWAVEGFFFSLTFSRAPKDELGTGTFEMVVCEILANVLEQQESETVEQPIEQWAPGSMLCQLAKKGAITNIIGAPRKEVFEKFATVWEKQSREAPDWLER